MQGFIHLLLEAFVSETIGSQHLHQIRKMAGVQGPPLASQHYPDEVTTRLLQAISEYEQVALDDLLYQFGVYFMNAPLTHQQYRVYLEGHASARSLLDYVPMIHHQLGQAFKDASLPELRYIDHSPDLLEIIYASPRRLCQFLQGILVGVGQHFNETLEVREIECQHQGAPACRILVRFQPARRSGPIAAQPSRAVSPSSPAEPPVEMEVRRQREEEEDVLILHALAVKRVAASHPLKPESLPEPPLNLALSLFEIAHWLTASAVPAEYTRLSLLQRSLTRLTVQGFVEAKQDLQATRQSASSAVAALGGQGILAALRYRITPTGQAWLREKQQQRQGH